MWCEWVWILECWTYFLVLCTKLLIGLVICQAIFAKYCHNHYWKKRLSGAKRAHLLKDVWLNKFHHKMAIDKKWPFLSFTTATIFFTIFFSVIWLIFNVICYLLIRQCLCVPWLYKNHFLQIIPILIIVNPYIKPSQ